MKTIKFTVHQTKGEIVGIFLTVLFLQGRFWKSMLFYACMLYFLLSLYMKKPLLIVLGATVAWTLLCFLYRYIEARKALSEKGLLEETVFEIDADSILRKGQTFEIAVPLNTLHHMLEIRNAFLVYFNQRDYLIVPKKNLTPVELDRLRHLFYSVSKV
jgi:hypothetical protein